MAKFLMAALIGFLSLITLSDGAWALCNPGSKNCVQTSDIKKPTRCGGPTNPCQIDGGFGSQCQGNKVSCGNVPGKVNVYDPTARTTTSKGTSGTVGSAGSMRH